MLYPIIKHSPPLATQTVWGCKQALYVDQVYSAYNNSARFQ